MSLNRSCPYIGLADILCGRLWFATKSAELPGNDSIVLLLNHLLIIYICLYFILFIGFFLVSKQFSKVFVNVRATDTIIIINDEQWKTRYYA